MFVQNGNHVTWWIPVMIGCYKSWGGGGGGEGTRDTPPSTIMDKQLPYYSISNLLDFLLKPHGLQCSH